MFGESDSLKVSLPALEVPDTKKIKEENGKENFRRESIFPDDG
jgi:hypothetical protein